MSVFSVSGFWRLYPVDRLAWLLVFLLLEGCAGAALPAPEAAPVKLEPYTTGYKVLRGHRKIGTPYEVSGITYRPIPNADGYVAEGIASWYGNEFHGGLTANGERFDMHAISAAHTTLPLPTQVRITNLRNGRWTVARVNDRGPFVKGRLIDLSFAAAKELGFARMGTAPVRIEALTPGRHQQYHAALPEAAAPQRRAAPPQQAAGNKQAASPVAPTVTAAAKQRPTSKQVASRPAPVQKKQVAQSGRKPGGYFVQAGSFRDPGNAKRMAQQLHKAGQAQIRPRGSGDRTFFRVLFGPFSTPMQADGMVRTLSRLGINKPRIVTD